MKKLSLLFVCILTIASCEKDALTEEILIEETTQNLDDLARQGNNAAKSEKIAVCHKGKIINVSINAVPAHIAHGDAVDMDGDGYFDIDNACSETDCDDNDATLNPADPDGDGYSTCNPEPTGYFPADFDFQLLVGEYEAKIIEGIYAGNIVKFSINVVNDSYIYNDMLYCSAALQYVTISHGGLNVDSYMYGATCIINTSNGVLTFGSGYYGGVLDSGSTTISIDEGITDLNVPSTYFHDGLEFEVTKQ